MKCKACNGAGRVEQEHDNGMRRWRWEEICQKCNGLGLLPGKTASTQKVGSSPTPTPQLDASTVETAAPR